MNRRRKKRCKGCLKRLENNKWCINYSGCKIARNHKKIRELSGEALK